jgi:hypothetical protein
MTRACARPRTGISIRLRRPPFPARRGPAHNRARRRRRPICRRGCPSVSNLARWLFRRSASAAVCPSFARPPLRAHAPCDRLRSDGRTCDRSPCDRPATTWRRWIRLRRPVLGQRSATRFCVERMSGMGCHLARSHRWRVNVLAQGGVLMQSRRSSARSRRRRRHAGGRRAGGVKRFRSSRQKRGRAE